MTDHSPQAETERQNMLRRAEQFARLRDQFHLPSTFEDLPPIAEAARRLGHLAGLVQDLSEQLRTHSEHTEPGPGINEVREAYGKAAGHLSAATAGYGSVCRHLPFLHRAPEHPKDRALSKARADAFVLAQKGIFDTRDRLASARASMANGASALEDVPSVSRAARARSSQADHARGQNLAPSDTETQAVSPAQQQPPHAPGNTRAR